jgi:hypothetical protein
MQQTKEETHDPKLLFNCWSACKEAKVVDWEHGKTIALIKAKKDEHVATLNNIDPWDHFEIIVIKWKKIFVNVMLQNCFNTWEIAWCVKTNGN